MPDLNALSYPMLAIGYCNDVSAPPGRDHHSHLGATEWHPVAVTVRYAPATAPLGLSCTSRHRRLGLPEWVMRAEFSADLRGGCQCAPLLYPCLFSLTPLFVPARQPLLEQSGI
jgi:hypothetical protein